MRKVVESMKYKALNKKLTTSRKSLCKYESLDILLKRNECVLLSQYISKHIHKIVLTISYTFFSI